VWAVSAFNHLLLVMQSHLGLHLQGLHLQNTIKEKKNKNENPSPHIGYLRSRFHIANSRFAILIANSQFIFFC
jgi:hypothetical protein